MLSLTIEMGTELVLLQTTAEFSLSNILQLWEVNSSKMPINGIICEE
jgi:hypothetical protein